MSKYVAVVVDSENNGEVWWKNMRKYAPAFTSSLSRDGVAILPSELCDILRGMPGYNESDSPDYAPFPVIFYKEGHKDWDSLTNHTHLVFDELS
jgi:hypothetical protein